MGGGGWKAKGGETKKGNSWGRGATGKKGGATDRAETKGTCMNKIRSNSVPHPGPSCRTPS